VSSVALVVVLPSITENTPAVERLNVKVDANGFERFD
jgi:hypothetical protein